MKFQHTCDRTNSKDAEGILGEWAHDWYQGTGSNTLRLQQLRRLAVRVGSRSLALMLAITLLASSQAPVADAFTPPAPADGSWFVVAGGMGVNSSAAALQLNKHTGKLTLLSTSKAAGVAPGFFAWDHRQGSISAMFAANHGRGKPGTGLTMVQWTQQPSQGSPRRSKQYAPALTSFDQPGSFSAVPDPDHVAVHPSNKWVLTSSYDAGTVTITPLLPTAQGQQQLGSQGTTVPTQHVGAAPHEVAVDPTNPSIIYVPCLESDWLRVYSFNAGTGALTPFVPAGSNNTAASPNATANATHSAAPSNTVTLPPGSGPRHIVFHPRLPVAYVVTELASTVIRLDWHRDSHTSTNGQAQGLPLHADFAREPERVLSTLPPGLTPGCPIRTIDAGGKCRVQAAAELQMSADGRFLYVSNRGEFGGVSSIGIFAISQVDGSLTALAWETGGGDVDFPRHFSLTPDAANSFLLVANQNSNSVTVFSRDSRTGMLTKLQTLPMNAVLSQASFVSVVPPPTV